MLLSIIRGASAGDAIGRRVGYQCDPAARDLLRLEAGASAGVAVGDPVLVFLESELVGAGAVSGIEEAVPLATLDFVEWSLPERGRALVIPKALVDGLRPRLPPFVTEGRRCHTAAQTQQAHGTSSSQPAEPGRLRAPVVAVEDGPNGEHVRLGNPEATPIGIGDRFDVLRGARYIGFAKAIAVDGPTVRAEALASLCASAIEPGDVAVRRPPAGWDELRWGTVFRVDRDYALVSLGEADGVRIGDRLFARGPDGGDRRLTVERVYPDHCGAAIETHGSGGSPMLALWTLVCTPEPGPAFVEISTDDRRSVGVPWLVQVAPGPRSEHLREGDFVRLGDGSDSVGVALWTGQWGAYVYVPGLWSISCGKSAANDD